MEKAQIYRVPNWNTRNRQEWFVVLGLLSWPYHTREEHGALSGVDCTVLVIQELLRNLNHADSQQLLRHYRNNFLIDFAVRNFARSTNSQYEHMQNARDVFWGVLCRHRLGTSATPSFLEINQSHLMQATLWGRPEMQPFHEIFVQGPDSDDFTARQSLKEDPSDLSSILTSRSLFVFDTSLYTGPEKMFKAHFRETHVKGAHGTYTFYAKAPKILRVLFDPTRKKLEGLSIFDLYRVPMPSRTVTHKPRTDGEAGTTVSYSAHDWVTNYSLTAVVRLRNSQHEHDYFRRYNWYGEPVVPRAPAGECTSYHNDDWSIADQDHRYMLFYAHIADAEGFVQPPSSKVPQLYCMPPDSPRRIEVITPMPCPMPAPWVRGTASEVARPARPPVQRSNEPSFDDWAAAYWAKDKAEKAKVAKQADAKQADAKEADAKKAEQAEQVEHGPGWRKPHPKTQGEAKPEPSSSLPVQQATGSSTQPGSSRGSESFILPFRSRPSSLATERSVAQPKHAYLDSLKEQASSALQGKSPVFPDRPHTPKLLTLNPDAKKQPNPRSGEEVRDTGEKAGQEQAGSSHEPESHKSGKESMGPSTSTRIKRKATEQLVRKEKSKFPSLYSSSVEEEKGPRKERHEKKGD